MKRFLPTLLLLIPAALFGVEDIQQVFDTGKVCAPIAETVVQTGLLDNGIFWAFLFVFAGGFLTSLTPCAFPIILISIPSLAKKEGSTPHKFLISLTYVAGIATMYASLGVITASSGKAFGTLMANPWVLGVFVAFFILMAFASLGAFVLQLPSSLQTKLSKVGGGSGFMKAFLSGLFLGILAAPCVGPVLAGVLAYIAQSGNILLGFLLLTTFALGMGVLILIIGTFSPSWKAGAWMEKVNTLLGILLLVAALYFLKDILPSIISPLDALYAWSSYNALIFLGISITILAIGFLVGPFKFEEIFMLEWHEKLRKTSGALIMAIALFMIAGLLLFVKGETKVKWIYSEPKGIELAQQNQKGIMIDFGAKWCSACKELDKYTYSDTDVANEIKKRFVPVYVDCTKTEEDKHCALANDKYGIGYQLPSVIFVDSCGRIREDLTLKGYENAEKFLKRLQNIQ